MIKIELTPSEVNKVRRLSNQREDNKGSMRSTRHWLKKNHSTHFYGLLGEYALSKYTGWSLDDRDLGKSGDKGVDFEVGRGTIQVKTVSYKDPVILKFREDMRDFKTDFAVAVYKAKNTELYICGYISKEDFVKHHYVRSFGYGNRCCVDDDKLRPIQELL